MKQIEILAPAGSYESLKAAINASCDAVYIGGNRFGARAYANNLSDEELLEAIDYAHIHNKRLYLTVNTLLKNQELEMELYDYLKPFYERGLDAVIVQDIGVLSFIHRNFPGLPIHASTQMTITMSKSLPLLKQYGVTRIVTSRELSLTEIQSIRKETDLEIESFVHGALCYCYSGQCLMSSMLGGRSGNRGRCAQPCRMPYTLKENGKKISNDSEQYLLSPKDICTLEIIPELIEAGIDSFKIEGRMKRPEYTALAAHLYRKYTDLYVRLGKQEYKNYIEKHKTQFHQDIQNLMELYNRGGSTQGYYTTYNGKNMMSSNRPNHSGVLVGKVISLKGNRAKIHLCEEIQGQDILEFRDSRGEVLYEYTVKDRVEKNQHTETNFKSGSKIKIGDQVYRTKNNVLLEEIAVEYIKKDQKVSIEGWFHAVAGEPMRLELTYQNTQISVEGDLVEQAEKQPITADKIREQLNKTNTSQYQFNHLEIEMSSNIFIPVSKLNEIRREGLEQLTKVFLKTFVRKIKDKDHNFDTKLDYNPLQKQSIHQGNVPEDMDNAHSKTSMEITVHVGNLEQLHRAVQFNEVENVCLRVEHMEFSQIARAAQMVYESHKSFYVVMPYIFRKNTYELFEKAVLEKELDLGSYHIKGFVIKNMEELEFLHKHLKMQKEPKHLILDYNLYVMNKEAKYFWNQQGIDSFTAPVELNEQELRNLGCEDSQVIVYGHIPLMTSTQCVVKNTVGCHKKEGVYTLQDRYNKNFYVVNNCRYCYNTVYNGSALSLLGNRGEVERLKPKSIRLDFTLETPDEMNAVLKNFIKVYRYNSEPEQMVTKDYTKGHFKRGIE